jgi:alpha-1,6-mannosyltransferase
MDFRKLKLYQTPLLLVVSCIAFYAAFAYDLQREDFFKLIGLYAGLFFMSFKLIQLQKHSFILLAGIAIVFRLIFLFAIPNLSQDFYRFIWDGRLIAAGWNPFQFVPNVLIDDPGFNIPQAEKLIAGMGSLSAGNYSNYPPVNQLIFSIAGWLASSSILGSVVIFRFIIILADLGTLFFGGKLLKSLKMPQYRIFWYVLNPFIIIEMTGNLHFETVMVFFLVWSLYLLHKGKWFWSAVIFAISISVKLLPLMLLPFLFRYFFKDSKPINQTTLSAENNFITHDPERSRRIDGFWKLSLYYIVCISTVIIFFFPFYSSDVASNFIASVGLWFGKFEFNASIYYLVRWIGFEIKGYNIIGTAGRILPLITLSIILGLSFFRKNRNMPQLLTNMLFGITSYLLLSTTVHPWYLAIPLILSVFTEMKYMIVWSAVVMLSYFAYSNHDYQENLWLVGLEYAIVFYFLVKELLRKLKPVVA